MYKGESGEKEARRRWTTVRIDAGTREKLEQLRRELGARSLAEVIKLLVNEHEEAVKRRVKAILCNDLREVSASVVGWIRLLVSRGLRAGEIQQAFEYLAGTAESMRVRAEKCKEE
ncbi:MAG: hypothetical protein QW794_01700 [Thermosphaera sp.]